MKIIITEEQKKKLFIPRKLSSNDSRYSDWNNSQPIKDGVRINQYDPEGRKTGYWEEYWDGSTKLYSKGKYKKGNQEGMWEYYENNGDLWIKGNFKNNKEDGVWEDYVNNKLKAKFLYDKGRLIQKIPITESEQPKKKLFIPRKLSQDDSRYSEWNNNQPVIDGIKINQYDPEGRKQGMWMTYFRDGRLNSKGTYKDNEKDGLWEEYWGSSGKLMVKGYYINGKEDGLWEDYWTNGNLENKGQYINGKMEGMWESYWSNGNPHSKGKYINDNKHGIWEFYFDDGSLEKKILYNNDRIKNLSINESKKLFIPRKLSDDDSRYADWNKQQPIKDGVRINQYDPEGNKTGYWEYYWDNGNLRCKGNYTNGNMSYAGNYVNGLKNGTWTGYWSDGGLFSKENYKDGKLDGVTEYYNSDKSIQSRKLYKNGKIINPHLPLTESKKLFIPRKLSGEGSRWEQWNKEQPIKDGVRINQYDLDGKKQGYWEGFDEDGEYLDYVGSYKDGLKNGLWKFYGTDGQLESEGNYINDSLEGNWKFYYDNGDLYYRGNYNKNEKDGVWEYYHENGKTWFKSNYKNGKYIEELPITESEQPKKKLFVPRKIEDRYSNWNEQQPTITLDNHTLKLNQYSLDGNKIGLWLNKPEIINQNYIETKPFMENLFNNLNVVKRDRFTNYKLNDKIIFQNRNDDTLTYFNNDFWTSFETKYQVFHFETKDLISVWMEIKYGLGHLYPHQVV